MQAALPRSQLTLIHFLLFHPNPLHHCLICVLLLAGYKHAPQRTELNWRRTNESSTLNFNSQPTVHHTLYTSHIHTKHSTQNEGAPPLQLRNRAHNNADVSCHVLPPVIRSTTGSSSGATTTTLTRREVASAQSVQSVESRENRGSGANLTSTPLKSASTTKCLRLKRCSSSHARKRATHSPPQKHTRYIYMLHIVRLHTTTRNIYIYILYIYTQTVKLTRRLILLASSV